jgi:hypothetical protein
MSRAPRIAPRSLVGRPARRLLAPALAGMLMAGCATGPGRQPEGSVAFRSASGPERGSEVRVVPGPAFRHPGLLTPAQEPVWQSGWVEQAGARDHPLVRGAEAGTTAGMAMLQVAPFALMFWPAAVGVFAGAVAFGVAGAAADPHGAEATRMSPPDRLVISRATERLQPDRLWRASMTRALAQRNRAELPGVPCGDTCWQETATPEVLAGARDQGLDGVLQISLEGIGLAAGGGQDIYGVFVQVRVRAIDASDGLVRYERVLAYGPGRTPEGLPAAETYMLEFLAADQGLTYRHIASETIRRVARLLADDPSLPLPAR